MQLYSCKVRLSGSLNNEARLDEVTIPEIIILQYIHGKDSGVPPVVEIKPLGREAFDVLVEGEKPVLRTEKMERDRLMRRYDPNDKFLTKEIFGVGRPLPQVLEGVDNAIVPAEPARRKRPPDTVADMVA